MKKLLFLLLTVSLSTVFAKGGHKSSEELCEIEHVVLLTDLTPEITKEFLKGRLPSTAIECRENMILPVAYLMKAPFFFSTAPLILPSKFKRLAIFVSLKNDEGISALI
ncbi:MAG: hypothetical protein KBA81_00095 [Rhabdochlamydiaceae bacterium]|nr:hypothetical protein [Rhabdochlamydiaceae bacterium]